MKLAIAAGKMLFALMPIFLAVNSINAADYKSKIDPFANFLVENDDVVGLTVGVYKNGERQVLGYGEIKKGDGQIPNGQTVYEIGSITKVFTGTILADMVLKGEVQLEDPADKYLPEEAKLNDTDHPITLLDLATQTSGLPYMPDNLSPKDPFNPYADYTADKMYVFIKDYKLTRLPGNYEYSNLGMGLLGQVLSLKAGKPYEELLLEHICQPLKLNDTRITLTEEMKSRLAVPYDLSLNRASNWDITGMAGAGAIRSTCDDMLKFAEASIKYKEQPLGQASEMAQKVQRTPPNGPAMGLAWHIAADGITRWHNGGTGGYSSFMAVMPDSDLAVVVLCNTANANKVTEFGENITRVMAGKDVPLPVKREVVKVSPDILRTYVGVYQFVPGMTMTVTLEEDGLMAQVTGQPKFPVFAESETDFFFKIAEARITFTKDEAGKVNALQLHQGGITQTANKIE